MAPSFSDIQNDASPDRIFIVGGGIVGAALAFYLSEAQADKQIVIVDKSPKVLLGSTGYAPGFVGQLNTSSVLTALARDTVKEYLSIPGGFDAVGGLELATTPGAAEDLKKRYSLAQSAGLPAEIISPEKAAGLAPDFVKQESVISALHFLSDGTANADTITKFFRQGADARGVVSLQASVTGFEAESGSITAILTSEGPLRIHANSPVILATGIWTQSLLQSSSAGPTSITDSPIPIIPVDHPYTYTPTRPARTGPPYPFVRWPEQLVYARDHGDRDGLGSFNHVPTQADTSSSSRSAVGPWPAGFEAVITEACRTCLKNGDAFLAKGGSSVAEDVAGRSKPFNGIFSMTPDNLPLAGKVKATRNLWLCAAVWVTHAAGTAKLITRELLQKQSDGDEALLQALAPDRFRGEDPEVLTKQALGHYNDIYNKKA
jgi:glycine/D-amino acid oxidase-like deaminating enzyme